MKKIIFFLLVLFLVGCQDSALDHQPTQPIVTGDTDSIIIEEQIKPEPLPERSLDLTDSVFDQIDKTLALIE